MKLEISRHIFKKYTNIKFHENPSNRSRVRADLQRDMTNAAVTFRNFANLPKIKPILIKQ